MANLLQTVVAASRHLLWYFDWQTHGAQAARAARR
jgi:hypothetical protein